MLADERRRRRDRRLVTRALIVAVVLHALFVLLRVPAVERDLPPLESREGPTIVDLEIIPPPIEPIRTRTTPPIVRRLPVVMPTPPRFEPVLEPPAEPACPARLIEPTEIDIPDVAPVAPPHPRIFEEGDPELEPPVPLERPQPEYPEPARNVRLEGRVVLEAIIDTEGRVASVEVLSATRPDLGFSEAAIAAVSRWRYEPGRHRGRPVPVRLRVIVDFDLQ
jgi:protein TonB